MLFNVALAYSIPIAMIVIYKLIQIWKEVWILPGNDRMQIFIQQIQIVQYILLIYY